MIQAFDAYRIYQSVKLHFTSDSYDCFRYNFKTSVNQKSFLKRNDRYFFHKVAMRFRNELAIAEFYAANIIDDVTYVSHMLESDDSYLKWQKKIQAITRIVSDDVDFLANSYNTFDELFTIRGNYPIIINELNKGSINLETVSIINSYTNFLNQSDKLVTEPLFYPGLSKKIKKYGPFVRFDKEKIKQKIVSTYLQTA